MSRPFRCFQRRRATNTPLIGASAVAGRLVVGPREALAARFGSAVNSVKGPMTGQEGNDAESGPILEPAMRIHAG